MTDPTSPTPEAMEFGAPTEPDAITRMATLICGHRAVRPADDDEAAYFHGWLQERLEAFAAQERERIIAIILGGRFLHEKAPPKLFADEVVAAIRRQSPPPVAAQAVDRERAKPDADAPVEGRDWPSDPDAVKARAIVIDFSNTFYTPPSFNAFALERRISCALAAERTAARLAGWEQGREDAARLAECFDGRTAEAIRALSRPGQDADLK